MKFQKKENHGMGTPSIFFQIVLKTIRKKRKWLAPLIFFEKKSAKNKDKMNKRSKANADLEGQRL